VNAPAADAVLEVDTVRVRRGSIVQRISAPGSVDARRESPIGAEVPGRIQQVFVREGDRLEAGDPLFQIEAEPYEIAERQAAAGLDLARAQREQIEADLKRATALRRSAVVAEDEVDRLTNAVTVASARERQAAEALALARRNLEHTLVRAPFAGSVARRLVDEGTTALLQPQTIVVVLQETAELEAEAAIPEAHMASVQLSDPALIHVEGVPQPIPTEVSALGDTIDPATRTFVVRMRVPNPEHRLKAGVFARVEILPRAKSDVLLLPLAAIRSEDGRARVFTVKDGRSVALPVQLGIVSEDSAEVLHGVRVDTEVIVGEAAQHVAPGMPVRVRDGAP
jgi:RND family efflux transporter MFP subunit